MTEDENGRIRVTEENELLCLNTEDFFIKLLVFKEKLDKRLAQLKTNK